MQFWDDFLRHDGIMLAISATNDALDRLRFELMKAVSDLWTMNRMWCLSSYWDASIECCQENATCVLLPFWQETSEGDVKMGAGRRMCPNEQFLAWCLGTGVQNCTACLPVFWANDDSSTAKLYYPSKTQTRVHGGDLIAPYIPVPL